MADVATYNQDLAFFGLELGCRMTTVKCGENIFVHSPIKITSEIEATLTNSGTVRWVVAPNKWHHLYIQDFQNRFPNVEVYGAPGLENKRRDLKFTAIITNEQHYPWNPHLQHLVTEGIPMYNEVVFYHPSTKTLLLTDLAVNVRNSTSWRTKLWLTLLGSYGHFGWSKLEQWLFIKDKVAFQKTLEKIMTWDFDRVIVSHGEVIETNGHSLFRNAWK